MWIGLWDLFVMKKLLKSEVCGSREQCTGSTDVPYTGRKFNNYGLKKKKHAAWNRKRENVVSKPGLSLNF